MIIMKKILNIVGVSVLLFTCASCQDWLDMPSESKADSSSVFETIGRAEMAVVGAYPNIHTQELGYQLLEGTDEASSSETNSKYNVSNYDYTSTSSMLSGTYNGMYKAIEYTNVCIKNIPLMKVSESEQPKLNSLLGEALAIRAYAYWNIVRFYGDVPYTEIPTSDLTTFSSSRVSRDTIYDHCVRDLQRAVELLPWQSEGMVSTPERFTKNSAYGILARVALYAAGYSLRWDLSTVPYNASTVRIAQREDKARIRELYQIAADACKAVIVQNENGLLDDYDEVFRDLCTKQYNKETMLEYGWYGANSSDVRTGYVNGIPTNGCGGQRRDVSICNYGLYTDGTYQMNTYIGAGVGKYRINWCKNRGTSDSRRDINFPLLRYSDVLLMYAEALNELNNAPTADAIDAFKQVRMRAFKNDEAKIGTIPSDYEGFKNAIIQERKLELSHESLRKTDLTRWGILYEQLTAEKEKLYQLANREGKYANVDVYRAYKGGTAVYQDPTIALPYITIKESDFKTMGLTADEIDKLNILNDNVNGGFLEKEFYEDEAGNVYFSKNSAPSGTKLTPVTYTILNMFGCHTIKSKGGLYVDSNVYEDNTFITRMFYGLQKNMVEILPFSTTSIIDVNPGLAGQQHPCY